MTVARLRQFWPALLLLLVPLVWLLPARGQVVVQPGSAVGSVAWPQLALEGSAQPGQPLVVSVRDREPLAHVRLTVNGQPAAWLGAESEAGGVWHWRWRIVAPDAPGQTVVFYHECLSGCIERGRARFGTPEPAPSAPGIPTRLGVVFPDPARDWHGRQGWAVELTYARLSEEPFWGVDDLAARVHEARARGLRVLVRVDYDQGQSLPPTDDNVALETYLQFVARLARDARLREVYGFVIGSGYNGLGSNQAAPANPVTPEWAARLFNGFGEAMDHTDNVVQRVRPLNPSARLLVGPVQPWNFDQSGARPYAVDAPWLHYFHTLVAALDEGARAKEEAGIALAAPDGFALQAPGRPSTAELLGRDPADEPRLSLPRDEWDGAQVGFQVYRDWMDIINAFPATRGLPAFITSTNTFAPDEGVPPAQNYPRGWLTTALEVINHEPQIQALCWFADADRSGDARWELYSLNRRPARLLDAAAEFDALLQQPP